MINKNLIIKVGVLVVLPLLLLVLVVHPLWLRRLESLDEKITESVKLLKQYAGKGDPLPSALTLDYYAAQKEDLRERYEITTRYMDPTPTGLPPGTREPGLYFREELYTVKKRLEQMAKESKSTLPESIGFTDELPNSKEVPILLQELDITNRIAEILLSGGVSEISLLKPLARSGPGDNEYGVGYRVIAVQVTFRSDISAVVGILHHIATTVPVLVTNDVQIRELSSHVIETSLVVSQVLAQRLEG